MSSKPFNPFKGTPGPWKKEVRYSKRGNASIVVVIPERFGERVIDKSVLTLCTLSDDDCGVETCCRVDDHANAYLIAAAPDLLQVAEENYKALNAFLRHPLIPAVVATDIKKEINKIEAVLNRISQ